jgi:DNA-binding transcriptional regulator LsrR (DeoR family)
MPRLDTATRNIAIGRLQAGESQNEVARTLNVNQRTISMLWNRFQQTGSTAVKNVTEFSVRNMVFSFFRGAVHMWQRAKSNEHSFKI